MSLVHAIDADAYIVVINLSNGLDIVFCDQGAIG